jgi:hypothetical protein
MFPSIRPQRLPDAGCRLMKLEGFHPAAGAHPDGAVGARPGVAARRASLRGPDEPAQLVAYLKTPRGLVELD